MSEIKAGDIVEFNFTLNSIPGVIDAKCISKDKGSYLIAWKNRNRIKGFTLRSCLGYNYSSDLDAKSIEQAIVEGYVFGFFVTEEFIKIKNIATVKCKKCSTPNEYAVANQPDGSFLCYSCR